MRRDIGGEPLGKLCDARHVVDGGDAVTRAPNVRQVRASEIREPAHIGGFFRQGFRIDAVTRNRRQQEIREHAGEAVGIDDVLDAAIDDHLLVRVLRVRLPRPARNRVPM